MTKCAVVQKSDNKIINLINAEPTDFVADGLYLVDVTNEQFVDIGWLYDPKTHKVYSPHPRVI